MAPAPVTMSAVDQRIGCHAVAGTQVAHLMADLHDFPRELMAQDKGSPRARQRIRPGYGNQVRPGKIFFDIRAADAAPIDAKHHLAWPRRRVRHHFHADVTWAMPACRSHLYPLPRSIPLRSGRTRS